MKESIEERSGKNISVRKLLEEAYMRLFPAIGYLISKEAVFLFSVVIFITWILTRSRYHYRGFSMEEDDIAIAKLLDDIKKQEAKLSLLEKARNELLSERKSTSSIDEIIEAEKNILENLYKELELRQLRVEAIRILSSMNDPNILKALEETVRRIEKSEKFNEQQYEILRELEEKWKRREIELNTLREILNSV